jgi:hypothetical protein
MPQPFDSIPGVAAVINDGGLTLKRDQSSPTVMIIGATSNQTVALEEPITLLRRSDLESFRNADGTPSEMMTRAQEVLDGGGQNVELFVLSDGTGARYAHWELNEDPVLRYQLTTRALDLLLNHKTYDILAPAGDVYIDATGLHSTENWAYLYADHCERRTRSEKTTIACIGVAAPTAAVKGNNVTPGTAAPTLAQLTSWITALNAWDTSSLIGAAFTIADGVTDADGAGVPDTYAFWSTTDSAIPTGSPPSNDGQVRKDQKSNPIDIGAYIQLCQSWAHFPNVVAREINPTVRFYNANIAGAYAGLIASLPPEIGTTNQPLGGTVGFAHQPSAQQANDLTRNRYVVGRRKNGRLTVVAGDTLAHNVSTAYRSDFVRLTTVRITQTAIDIVRLVADPFIGRPSNPITRKALESQLDEALGALQGTMLEGYDFSLTQSRTAKILGELDIDLTIRPALEIRTITVRVSLDVAQ